MNRSITGAMALAAGMAVAAAACGGGSNNNPAGPSNTGPIVFSVAMSAANEVPPVTNAESNARGTATITMNVPRDASGNPSGPGTLNFAVQLTGFPAPSAAVAAHIHPGAAGINGSPLVPLPVSAAAPIVMADGTGTLTFNNVEISQSNAQNIYSNPAGFYFNVHTPVNPGGAVRGQLARQQ